MKFTSIILLSCAALLLFLAACSCATGLESSAAGVSDHGNYAIVNLDAKISTDTNPVTYDLVPGTYKVTVIGIKDGGAFDAWKCWILGNGWYNKYSIGSAEFPDTIYMNGENYKSPDEALSNAVGAEFTLAAAGTVRFYIMDRPYYDNKGGISLKIEKL
jgi:hypothetical protein